MGGGAAVRGGAAVGGEAAVGGWGCSVGWRVQCLVVNLGHLFQSITGATDLSHSTCTATVDSAMHWVVCSSACCSRYCFKCCSLCCVQSMHWAPVKRMPPALNDTESAPKQHLQSSKVDSAGPSVMDVSCVQQGAVGISQFRKQSRRSSNLGKFREYKE